MTNGTKHAPLSMRINPEYKDPLAPKRHHVVASHDGGRTFYVLGDPGAQFVADPIELLKIEVEGQHACAMQRSEVRILDDDHEEVARFEPYYVEPEEGAPSPERLKLRDRWLEAMMRFLLPPSLYLAKDDPAKRARLARWLRKHKIDISIRGDGGAVVVFREGVALTSWGI